jgi:hypothetical protein
MEKPVFKMHELLKVWHNMEVRSIADFEVQGDVNVFGFTKVHVRDRASWDQDMVKLGTSLSRAPKEGRELKDGRELQGAKVLHP